MSESTIKLVNWGIIGAGVISGRFVQDIVRLHNFPQGSHKLIHTIKGIGCSSVDKAKAFVEENIGSETNKHNPKIGSYDEIFNDKEINAIYIGVLHPFHKDLAIKALRSGKNVLCEKPVTINSEELEEIIKVAKQESKFFMEAMWVRFFPAFVDLQKKIHQDKILGDIKRIRGNYSINAEVGPEHRVVNKSIGGSALLDIGVYSITYNRLFLDPKSNPQDWKVVSHLTLDGFTGKKEDEVDFMSTVLIANGKQQGIAISSMYNQVLGGIVIIEGMLGKVTVYQIGDTPSPKSYKVELKTGEVIEKDFLFDKGLEDSEGFYLQAVELGERVASGKIQSEVMSWDESVKIMKLMDKIRYDNEFYFPQDKK